MPVTCPEGSFSNSTSLEVESGCEVCPLGRWCSLGTARPEPCAVGQYGASPGQTNRFCTGPCSTGHYCEEGSTSSTSGVCRAQLESELALPNSLVALLPSSHAHVRSILRLCDSARTPSQLPERTTPTLVA